MNQDTEPKLARPGAGMPIPQRWIARFLVPFQGSRSNWDSNIERFNRYSKSIEDLAKSLTTDQLNTRYLVAPIMGLEDSSRYWSPAMIMDHLMITGPYFHRIISELSNLRVPPLEIRVENVKPPLQLHELGIVQKFHKFWVDFAPTLNAGPDRTSTRLKHPWFGSLSAHQWLYVLSLHHGVHLQQFKQIVQSFEKK